MKKPFQIVITLAVGMAIAAVGAALVSQPVIAQVRAALVKDVDNSARQPFEATTGGAGAADFPSGSVAKNAVILSVPAGKRAVFEHISCIDYLDNSSAWVRLEMNYTSNGVGAALQLVHTHVGPSFASGTDIWALSQPVRAYADAGTSVSINALRRTTSGIAGVECYATGYYVDMSL